MGKRKKSLKGLVIRVDDRLLHGQVIYGWGQGWPAKELWLVNDEIACDPAETELYTAIIPPEITGGVLTVEQAVSRWKDSKVTENVLVVVRDVQDLNTLLNSGIHAIDIHIGCLAANKDRSKISNAVYLNELELSILRDIQNVGFTPVLRELPGSGGKPVLT